MTSLDATQRSRTLDRLETEAFDLAVIGGGITGAGVAREAALRGLRVALLEADDFAAGTSSRSSKLIHGGLRYLAMGDVPLVRETALERKILHRMAPHLAERRWMVLPVRSRAGLLKFRTAITTYEKLGAVEADDVHRNWDSADLEGEEPLLDRRRFPFACAYREYLTDDARLVIANLRAADRLGGVCANHLEVVEVVRERSGRAAGLVARCSLSGRRLEVRAGCVVNAAGPWVEAVRRLEDRDAPSLLHLSKGVHVSIPRERLPLRNVVLMAASDKRSLFAVPRGDVTYVGTTDTSFGGGAEVWPAIDRGDVDYLLEPVTRYFPHAEVKASDIGGAWAGLRPLVAQPGKAPKDLSRKDEVLVGPAGIIAVAGGKLTGYRPMAIRILEMAAPYLPPLRDRPEEEPCLPGGDFGGSVDDEAARLSGGLAGRNAQRRRLVSLYGSEARDVVALGEEPLVAEAAVLVGEVVWAVTHESALRLRDVLYRRTRTALYEPGEREALLPAVAASMAGLLGWSASRIDEEIEDTRALFANETEWQGGA